MQQAVSSKRVAIMLPKFSRYGGVEQFGYRLAEGLSRRGIRVDFICARKETDVPEGLRVIAVGRPPGCRAFKLLWFLFRAEQLRKRGQYDLSISLGKTWRQDLSRMGGGPLSIFWKKSEQALQPGLPRLFKRIKRRLSPSNWVTFAVERHQFTADSEVIAVSHLVRDWLVEAHPALNPERVSVIYNRPDSQQYTFPSPEERQAAKNALCAVLPTAIRDSAHVCIGTASTNFELKGLRPLIHSLALLPKNAVLFIAGGRDHKAYSSLARELGLQERVVFCGKVDDMATFYHGLDIFILPTFYDACSNAVLEAMASGCHAISTSSNGASFFLEKCAILDDPGDVANMAKCLNHYIQRPLPGPFTWPELVPSGLESFMDYVEQKLKK